VLPAPLVVPSIVLLIRVPKGVVDEAGSRSAADRRQMPAHIPGIRVGSVALDLAVGIVAVSQVAQVGPEAVESPRILELGHGRGLPRRCIGLQGAAQLRKVEDHCERPRTMIFGRSKFAPTMRKRKI
jgi:hypothetical protein